MKTLLRHGLAVFLALSTMCTSLVIMYSNMYSVKVQQAQHGTSIRSTPKESPPSPVLEGYISVVDHKNVLTIVVQCRIFLGEYRRSSVPGATLTFAVPSMEDRQYSPGRIRHQTARDTQTSTPEGTGGNSPGPRPASRDTRQEEAGTGRKPERKRREITELRDHSEKPTNLQGKNPVTKVRPRSENVC
ncbi:alpha-N-acetylgalactosaminide alpha-2,6-sialyltransferase 5 isoform X2 [Pelobates cultripes]|uniref:Alpha-N-acetylgalactosaminide alpha-2,6-sialyltransferase 5 isoform X2 n=1 Tax=Pelobates cultripes TaxID=61616 RepID=A0AAD1SV74_PELCU|nr:alpha-N-acetylgalactosaminide alpha-2,6-sialyltransferase 5 isoform X2 [Pelobates cultripes]